MAIAAIFHLLWASLTAAKDTPIGRFLCRAMVELPAAAFDRLQRKHFFLAIVVTLLTIVAVCFQEPDGTRMVGLAIPDFAAWLTTFEVSTYLDLMASLVAAAAMMRPISLRDRVKSALALRQSPLRIRPRPRTSRPKAQKLPANYDEEGALLALAS